MGIRRYCRTTEAEIRAPCLSRELGVEFVAMFLYTSVQCCLSLSLAGAASTVTQAALGMAFIVTVNMWSMSAFGLVHMNPALSLAYILGAKITLAKGLLYILLQCLGAIAGAGFIYAITPVSQRGDLGVTQLGPEVAVWQGYLVETWLTFLFVVTALGSMDNLRKPNLFMHSIPIGLAMGVCILCGASYTGGSVNPASSLGPAVMMKMWDNHWIYWMGPFTGSCMASFAYYVAFDFMDNPERLRRKRGERDDISEEAIEDKEAAVELTVSGGNGKDA